MVSVVLRFVNPVYLEEGLYIFLEHTNLVARAPS